MMIWQILKQNGVQLLDFANYFELGPGSSMMM